ncbi:MAG: cell wall-binding repeat-containing protein [Candidatus Limnocylindrales bacterium]
MIGGLVVAVGLSGAADAAGPGEVAAPGESPSIQYQEAQLHAGDRIAFVTGDPVTVPLQPRTVVDSSAAGTTNGPPGAGAAGTTSGPLTAVKSGGLRREVFGFLPYWELSDSALRLDDKALSTIAYFGVGADRSGHLVRTDPDGSASVGWGGWASSLLTGVINTAHANGTRVVLTVQRFAWTSGQVADTNALLGNATARQTLANEIAAAVKARGSDGVNLDFEPIPNGQAANFVAFVRLVRGALNARGSGYQLTFDATGSIGNYDVANLTAAGAADAVLIMGYDYRGSASAKAGSIDPLSGPTYDLTDTVNAYLARTSASKIILGVPYYGRAWSTASDAPNAITLPQNSSNGYSSSATYAQAASLASTNGRRWDSVEQSPWTAYRRSNCTGCATVWRELYYDDTSSLGQRYDLVNRKGLRGAGIWALGYDGTRPELYALLKSKFVNDTTPPRTGIVRLAPTVGDEGFSVAWTGNDDFTGVAWYDLQVSVDGGAWSTWLTHTTATSAIYLGSQGHGYAFRVRAADGKGNVGRFNVADTYVASPTLKPGGFARVVQDGLGVRAAPGTAATLLMQASAGTLMRILAGPVSSGGLNWYQVTLPIDTWAAVGDQQVGVWVAAGASGTAYIVAARPPNSTQVQAAITGYGFAGAGSRSLGPGGAALRTLTPNGDGRDDTLTLDWTNGRAFSAMTLDVFRADGTLVGPVYLGARGAGLQHYAWPGAVGSTGLASGTYLLRLKGSDGSGTYYAPSVKPADAAQTARYAVALHKVGLERVAGSDRYATAAAVSAANFAPGAAVAFVTTGAGFADALGAGAAAGKGHGPVLLTARDALPAATAAELSRLKPRRIVVVGGAAVVGAKVLAALQAYTAGGVSRLAGADRYATAAAISAATFAPGVPAVYLVNGLSFSDGLAAAAAAARTGAPVLLTAPGGLAPATSVELKRLKPARIFVVGGPTAVPEAIRADLAAYTAGPVTRLAGGDRYETAAAVSAAVYGQSNVVYLATGRDFPDALAGSALGGPLLLVPGSSIPAAVLAEVVRLRPLRIVVLGSPAAVADAPANALRAALGG